MAIRAPETGHSLVVIFPVSPSPTGHFGKEQSGTDFGKVDAPNAYQRDHRGDCPAIGSFPGKAGTKATATKAIRSLIPAFRNPRARDAMLQSSTAQFR